MPPLCLRPADSNQREVLIGEAELIIGRGQDANITIDSPFVSRNHARIFQKEGRSHIIPIGLNPTFLNGRPLPSTATQLQPGDLLSVHGFEIAVDVVGARRVSEQNDAEFSKRQAAAHRAIVSALDARDVRSLDIASEEGRRVVSSAITDYVSSVDYRELAASGPFAARQAVRDSMLLDLFAPETAAQWATPTGSPATYTRGERSRDALVQECVKALGLQGAGLRKVLSALATSFDDFMDTREKSLDPAEIQHLTLWYLRKNLMDLMLGLGPLEDLLRLPAVSEVMVVSRSRIFIEAEGLIVLSGRRFATLTDLQTTIGRIVGPRNIRVDVSAPLADTSLADGSRVNIVLPPVALGDPAITIRRFSKNAITMDDLVAKKSISRAAAVFLAACVKSHLNIVVSGGTGTGKTTFLTALSGWIAPNERIVTIEDTAELKVLQPHVVSLLARPENSEGKGQITIADLVRNALRMRPDRLIIGECRGGEALAMIKAMNTGHDGSLTTGHANSPEEMVQRLEGMILEAVDMPTAAVRQLVAGGVNIIVQLARLSDGTRCMTSIAEVQGYDAPTGTVLIQRLFTHDPSRGLVFTGSLPECIEKLVRKGGLLPEQLFERKA